jgi:hypothetical protein
MMRMPSLWHTCEVQMELDQLQQWLEASDQKEHSDDDDGNIGQQQWQCQLTEARLLPVQEYSAVENVRSVPHFVGIARARSEKPRRQLAIGAKQADRGGAVDARGASSRCRWR